MEHIDEKLTRLQQYHLIINDIAEALGYRTGQTYEPEALVREVKQLVAYAELAKENSTAMATLAAVEEMEYLDEDGYPTEVTLEKIEKWDYKDGWTELMNFVCGLWLYADAGYWSMEKDVVVRDLPNYKVVADVYHLSTAGWSGNEMIIHALEKNWMFWTFCWEQSNRGGQYIFHVKNEELSVNNTTLDNAGLT
jgi:hypothetical protein